MDPPAYARAHEAREIGIGCAPCCGSARVTGAGQGTPRDKPPGRVRAWAAVALVAVVVAGVLLHGRLPDAALPDGPLDGGVRNTVSLPLRPGDTGAAWGALVLENPTGDTMTIDSVALGPVDGRLVQRREPYVWDESRLEIAQHGSLVAYQLPLPEQWSRVPKQALRGFELKPTPSGGVGPDAEVVFEFGVPERASSFSTVTIRYHVGWRHYSRTIESGFTLCPTTDRRPCS